MSGNQAVSKPLPDLHCACANLRRAARLVTQLYRHEMGSNVEPAQFSLLSALSQHPGASQAPLGRALGLDKTTMSRNLRLMQRNGWIEAAPTDDKRERGYRLTKAGVKILSITKPGWMRAQARLRELLKPRNGRRSRKYLPGLPKPRSHCGETSTDQPERL